ncbi:hypothetical protein RJT34_12404 [Clitoria ternatea]|uniref:Uncharacterized protein n=1 Tax=Clitoria ternatea TaxID=43366 RepID=A0AAN9JM33_CLITE
MKAELERIGDTDAPSPLEKTSDLGDKSLPRDSSRIGDTDAPSPLEKKSDLGDESLPRDSSRYELSSCSPHSPKNDL